VQIGEWRLRNTTHTRNQCSRRTVRSAYEFEFILADALSVTLDGYDFIWASPPCQWHTCLRHLPSTRDKKYPDLVTPTRKLLRASGKPYCLENVPGAPRREDLLLCGTMFQLGHGRQRGRTAEAPH
jgi:DNA (cytosine-5)-methyltransferase 1